MSFVPDAISKGASCGRPIAVGELVYIADARLPGVMLPPNIALKAVCPDCMAGALDQTITDTAAGYAAAIGPFMLSRAGTFGIPTCGAVLTRDDFAEIHR